MPCRGCKKDSEMVDKTARFKAKFIGKPGGVLMKGAPGNYDQDKIYSVPYSWTQFPYWELLDPPPVLKVPPAKVEESVFEDSVFVPPDMDEWDKKDVATKPEEVVEASSPVPSGQPSSESSVSPMAPPVEPVNGGGVKPDPIQELLDSVRESKQGLFGVEPDNEMPADMVYELNTLGDGVLGEKGVEKVERKRKKTKAES